MTGDKAPWRFANPAHGRLDQTMREAFARFGVLVIENFVARETCETLMRRAAELVGAFTPPSRSTVFSTRSHAHASDAYFKQSADQVHFFFEEDAFGSTGELRLEKTRAINKVGHALHDRDAVFDRFSRAVRVKNVCADVGVSDPRLIQSMYIFKQPRVGGEVDWHQDASFLHTEPQSVVGLWFALEEATLDNGCLHVLPGEHRGPLSRRFVRKHEELVFETASTCNWDPEKAVALPVPQGTLVILHGLVPHYSAANRSPHSRQAYALHVVDATCRYSSDNWLQRDPAFPARGF